MSASPCQVVSPGEPIRMISRSRVVLIQQGLNRRADRLLVVPARDHHADPRPGSPPSAGLARPAAAGSAGAALAGHEDEPVAGDVVDHREHGRQHDVGDQVVHAQAEQASVERQVERDRHGLLGLKRTKARQKGVPRSRQVSQRFSRKLVSTDTTAWTR